MSMPDKLRQLLGQPKGTAHYVKKLLKQKEMTITEAAKLIDVNQSTLSRYLQGSALTKELAVKRHKGRGLDIATLFYLEAQRNTAEAQALLST